MKTPFELIAENCQKKLKINAHERELLPKKWELLGDILILRLEPAIQSHWPAIAEEYAKVLDAHAVLRRIDKIRGIYRQPSVELIYGASHDTVHMENKVKFKFNPEKVMFSSGNIDERIRISKLAKHSDTVVDMFAGIGYMCLPIALHSSPTKIIACELNQIAYEYLKENIKLNLVEDIVQPILGDNRECIPPGVADRIVMGYIKTEHSHREAAFKILKPKGGVIHFHDVGFKADAIQAAYYKIQESMKQSGFNEKFHAEIFNHYTIKSYAPKMVHIVLDIKFNEK